MDIAAPAERVWGLIADITAMGQWSPITTSAAWVPPAHGPAVGAQFTGTNKLPIVRRWTSVCTVAHADPGRRFTFMVGTNPEDPNTTWSYDLVPSNNGASTHVTESWVMHHEPLVVRVYYRLIGQAGRIERGVEQTLDRLKAAAEREPR